MLLIHLTRARIDLITRYMLMNKGPFTYPSSSEIWVLQLDDDASSCFDRRAQLFTQFSIVLYFSY